jgi:hypothetical protein
MLKSGSSWNLVPLPASSTKGGWEGRAKSSEIRLGRGTTYLVTRSYIKNQPTSWLVHLRNHSWCWDKPRATQTHLTHHGPDSGEATTFPHIVFSTLLHRTHIRMAFVPGLPRWSLEIVPKLSRFGLLGLHKVIILCSDLLSGWGLKQTCSPPWELSNGVSHSPCTHRVRVDSRLLVKLPIWLPAFLLHITCAADDQMAHASPFSTSTLS